MTIVKYYYCYKRHPKTIYEIVLIIHKTKVKYYITTNEKKLVLTVKLTNLRKRRG